MDNSLQEKYIPFFQKHWLPILLGASGLMFLVYGLVSLTGSNKQKEDILFESGHQSTSGSAEAKEEQKKITIDVEGAVEKPGVYSLPSSARVQDALIAAGGMSRDADRVQIAKGLNLAAKIVDGGKIYIPRSGEQALASSGNPTDDLRQNVLGSGTININIASAKDLDILPGVGEVTAQKIISNRPYGSVDELLSKKVVGQKVFEQIKEKIAVY
jgi:competence protein ComEA